MTGAAVRGNDATMVYLRPLRAEDAAVSWRWRNDPEVWKKTVERPNVFVTEEIERAWAERVIRDNSRRNYAICLADGDRYIGNAYIVDIDWKTSVGFFGVFIGDKEMWGRGIGHRVHALLEREARSLGIRDIVAVAREEQFATLRIVTKAGFVRERTENGIVYLRKCLGKKEPEN